MGLGSIEDVVREKFQILLLDQALPIIAKKSGMSQPQISTKR
jgi:hypothetical protein